MAIAYRTQTSNYTTVVTTNSVTIPATTVDGDLLILYALSSANGLTVADTTRRDRWEPLRIAVTDVNTVIWGTRAISTDASSTLTVNYNTTATGTVGLIVIQGPAYVRWVAPPQHGSLGTSTLSTNTFIAGNGDVGLYLAGTRTGGGATAPSLNTGTNAIQRTDGTLGGIAINYEALSADATPTPTMTTSATGSSSLDVIAISPGPDTLVLPPYSVATTNAHTSGRILKGRLTTTLDDAAGA